MAAPIRASPNAFVLPGSVWTRGGATMQLPKATCKLSKLLISCGALAVGMEEHAFSIRADIQKSVPAICFIFFPLLNCNAQLGVADEHGLHILLLGTQLSTPRSP